MTSFWMGYLAAVLSYLVVGFLIGVYIVVRYLPRFHGGGFAWKQMAKHVGTVTIYWPVVLAEIIGGS